MKRFRASELRRFLTAVDLHLEGDEPVELVIVGGAATTVGYGLDNATKDIDTFSGGTRRLQAAARKARADTGLQVPLGPAGIAELPYYHDTRLVPIMPRLEHMKLFVPELHDLALSKLNAGREPDLEAVEDLHKRHGLDFDLLVRRYVDEMRYAVGRPEDLDLNFLAGIQRAFGDEQADEAAQRLRAWREAKD